MRPGRDTSAATTYTDINGLAALKSDPNSPQAISAVAQQVEALFLQMMLKSMRDATAAEETDSNEMGMYQDMFDKQVALEHQPACRFRHRRACSSGSWRARRRPVRRN